MHLSGSLNLRYFHLHFYLKAFFFFVSLVSVWVGLASGGKVCAPWGAGGRCVEVKAK